VTEGAAEGATVVVAAPGGVLVHARYTSAATAGDVVAQLRAEQWAAVARPNGGGHLAAWQRHTAPVVVAGALWVCFPWTEADRSGAAVVVDIDPGSAFGAGRHPSTRLLLAELVQRLQGGEAVLDVGCGSGVLAVSAARLGAAFVRAVDVDDAAIVSTRANAARNRVAELIDATAMPVTDVRGTYDVIVANIGASTLVELAPALQARLAPEAWLGLSGLSPAQVSRVAAAYPSTRVIATPTEGDWAAVIAAAPAYFSAASSVSTDGAK
jgi:ribosomal protein L11 methyltransferase